MSFKNRVDKVKQIISKQGLDGLYVTNLTNVRYLTGFTGSAGTVLIINHKQYFFTDGRYIEQSKEQVKNCEIKIVNSAIKTIKQEKIITGSPKLGFESEDLTVFMYNNLSKILSKVKWEPTNGIIEKIAAVKDQHEIDSLKTAIEITDEVFKQIIPKLKIGAVEKDISAQISYLFKTNGADGDSYESIIGSGYLGALPHARPSDKKFEKGDFVVMDFGALYNGYHADMTRTIVIGEATEKHKEIYGIVLESQLAGINIAKEGVTGAQVDHACRTVIKNAGMEINLFIQQGMGLG